MSVCVANDTKFGIKPIIKEVNDTSELRGINEHKLEKGESKNDSPFLIFQNQNSIRRHSNHTLIAYI
jgi:hypothetical protein